jgi:4-hydroxybenzoate polyprenyltransferase
MLFNRLADRRFDAENPRTQRRVLASGRLSVRQGWTAAVVAAGVFVLGCAGFWVFFGNPWPVYLAGPVLAWIAFYSLTKRFSVLCHVFLGGALAAAPLAAAIAIDPAALREVPALWAIAGMVLVWVAGFDVIYALQDVEFDRRRGLSSIPARLGASRALWVSRGLHVAAVALLVVAWRLEGRFGVLFLVGILAVAGLLVLEHGILVRNDTARTGRGLDVAFFTLNGVVSCVLGVLGVVDAVM